MIDPYAGYKAAVRDAAPERPASPTTSTSWVSPTRRSPTCEPDANRKSPATAAAKATRCGRCATTCCGHGNISPTAPGGDSARRSKRTGGTNSNAPDAQGDAPRPLHQRRPARRRSRTRGLAHLGRRLRPSPRRTGSPRPCAPGNPNCSPTSTPVSPTGPPKASTGSSKPSNAKASATPTPTTTASASSTAAPDTLNPPDNRTPLPHQTRRAGIPVQGELEDVAGRVRVGAVGLFARRALAHSLGLAVGGGGVAALVDVACDGERTRCGGAADSWSSARSQVLSEGPVLGVNHLDDHDPECPGVVAAASSAHVVGLRGAGVLGTDTASSRAVRRPHSDQGYRDHFGRR